MGKLTIHNLRFRSLHGHNEFERKAGNNFTIDAIFETGFHQAGQSDDLSHTLDYSKACECIAAVMNGESVKLIETLLIRIGESLLTTFPEINRLEVRLRKHTPPMSVSCDYVEIVEVWQK